MARIFPEVMTKTTALTTNFFDIRRSPFVKLILTAAKNRFVFAAILLLAAVSIWLTAWAFWYEPDSLTVKNYNIKIHDFPVAFSNFKIVVMSDIHGGSNFITEAKIRKVVELANAQNPDLIVLLGDYVSQYPLNRRELKMPIAKIADNLGGLRARLGVYAVLGNHDGWYDDSVVRQEFERVGYRVLENEAVVIEQNGAKLRLLGLKDALRFKDWNDYSIQAKRALEKIEPLGKILVLEHNPDAIPAFLSGFPQPNDLSLILAGHTHGGQVNLPLIGAPVVPANKKYTIGLIEENSVQIFVTPGIGTSILPVRFRVPPEISVLTLNTTSP
jgi:predicted MPP superfamily phosphohydrolase